MSIIRDINLAPEGRKKIAWAAQHMPLLNSIKAEFEETLPFNNLKIALSVHLEAKTAYLCQVLAAGGAQMYVTGSNPLSTQDDVAAALAESSGIEVFAIHGCNEVEYENNLREVLKVHPNIIIDDGGDLVHLVHSEMPDLIPEIIGGCEETTTGILRLKVMEKESKLKFPMVMVNDADCKHLFDNRYGTGQSVWDGINRTTNLIVAGKTVVVAGYGWCGKGVAMRAWGLGAQVIVTEVDPVKAIEAVMDGFDVMTMDAAASVGDFFITVTGCSKIITDRHFKMMKSGAILANAGHFDVEVDMATLNQLAIRSYAARQNIQGYTLANGNTIFVIAEGRLVNLASGDGHPAEIMDMSFAIQALSAQYLVQNRGKLSAGVVSVPAEIDHAVAFKKLDTLGLKIDSLTDEQKLYLGLD